MEGTIDGALPSLEPDFKPAYKVDYQLPTSQAPYWINLSEAKLKSLMTTDQWSYAVKNHNC